MNDSGQPDTQSRAERKEQTRRQLLDAGLELAADRGLSNVSLRDVAKAAGIVPTAFYRHFGSIDELGLTLADEGMRTLRIALRDARKTEEGSLRASVRVLANHLHDHRALLQFVYRERTGGGPALRRAIQSELGSIVRDLTIDLSRLPRFSRWSAEDLDVAAELIVSASFDSIGALVSDRAGIQDDDEAVRRIEKQLRIILLGMQTWQTNER